MIFLFPPALGSQARSPDNPVNLIPVARPKAEASSGASSPLLRIDSSLVLIPVHATTPVGTPILDLSRADFRLFEDGVEQTVAQFAKEERPVSVAVVYDASGSMKGKALRASLAIAEVLRSANPEDEFCLVKLNGRPRVAVPFTTDTDRIREEVARTKPGGSTSLLDAVYLATAEIRKAHNPRKGIIIVSDGGDNWSRHSVQSIKRLLVEADAQLFAMGIYEPTNPLKNGIEERNGPVLLDDLAKQTGGREYAVESAGDLPAIGERIASALRSEYLLGYYPANKTQDGKYRYVTLRMSTPAAKIRLHYRHGYYAIWE